MNRLTHYRLCPHSRAVRLALAEAAIEAGVAEVLPWEQKPEFLALNPAGELPVLELEGGLVLCGAYAISEYVAEELRQHPRDAVRTADLFPGGREDRAEVRRLVDWFHRKFDREVTRELLYEKGLSRQVLMPQAPDPDVLRAVRANLRYHLSYVDYLAHHRSWLAGDALSFADLSAAAHLSIVDYLGEVPWDMHPQAKTWYARLKSRPSFRTLLADRVAGVPPPIHYTNLDF